MNTTFVPMIKYKFDWKQWFILDESPEYFLISRDIPIGDISPKEYSALISFVFDEHRRLWESMGHNYAAGDIAI